MAQFGAACPAARAFLVAATLASVSARCANNCNSRGRCVGIQSCECFGGWGGADCSQREERSTSLIALAGVVRGLSTRKRLRKNDAAHI